MCVSNERERSQKFGSQLTPKVNVVQEGREKQTKKNTEVEQALMKELGELKAEVAAVKERVRVPPQAQNLPTQYTMRQSGNGWRCNHCFRCGASGHYVCECTARFSQRSPAELRGNGQRSRPWDRVLPGMKISPVALSVENKEPTIYRLTAIEAVRPASFAERDVKENTELCTNQFAWPYRNLKKKKQLKMLTMI